MGGPLVADRLGRPDRRSDAVHFDRGLANTNTNCSLSVVRPTRGPASKTSVGRLYSRVRATFWSTSGRSERTSWSATTSNRRMVPATTSTMIADRAHRLNASRLNEATRIVPWYVQPAAGRPVWCHHADQFQVVADSGSHSDATQTMQPHPLVATVSSNLDETQHPLWLFRRPPP